MFREVRNPPAYDVHRRRNKSHPGHHVGPGIANKEQTRLQPGRNQFHGKGIGRLDS